MKEFYTPKEAVIFFPWLKPGRGESTIRLWIKEGKLKAEAKQDDPNNPRTRRYRIHIKNIILTL